MADAISFDESYWVEEIDVADPESLSNVFVDYTPAFNLGECFKSGFEVYLKYVALLDPMEADVLILYHYCDKKVKEIAKILRTTPVKVSGLIHQAESRLALLLHINIMLTSEIIDELKKFSIQESDLTIFLSYLREVSRRRSASVLGLTFHQVNAGIKRVLDILANNEASFELQELIKVLEPFLAPPRETRQLDQSERSLIVDVISCPQQIQATITIDTPTYTLGCFHESNQELLEPFASQKGVSYFSVGQAILAQASNEVSMDFIVAPFIMRLTTPFKHHLPVRPMVGPVVFLKKRVQRDDLGKVNLSIKPARRRRHSKTL